MRKLITLGLLALLLTTTGALLARDNDSNQSHRHGSSHGQHSGRHAHGSSTNPMSGRTYYNPQFYAFDWLYNPYFRNPFSYYPSYGWGYSPWYGYSYMPRRYDITTSLSIGTGYQNSWYPGSLWF
ncbi:MAG: hypothetical protein KDD51_04440 [Bdellovibrionales bacterium]|nr:hypothetical protein [Bdellovibrionales bacterium]